jgi:RluA family pseudouridine synthase
MKKVPAKYQPRGFKILHEDLDIIVGNKAPGLLTVAAKWEADNTVHGLLNQYVRKGNPRSNKVVYVVHRLDQATSGVLIFAKSEAVQHFLKDNWKTTTKTYYAIVHGHMATKSGIISSYLSEDENYMMHSSEDSESGKLAQTEYVVVKETPKYSLVKINLLTGKKNQIRVHMAEAGHPIVGDAKYGPGFQKFNDLRLHSAEIDITHPHKKVRMSFKAPVPEYFKSLVAYEY